MTQKDWLVSTIRRLDGGHLATAAKNEVTDRGIYLALSGGGFRAAARHLGSILCLLATGTYSRLRIIASVSGGGITAGRLAQWWTCNKTGLSGLNAKEIREFAAPLARVLQTNVRRQTLFAIAGRLNSKQFSPLGCVLDKHLFHGMLLKDLPQWPRFIFCATDTANGSSAYFHRMGLSGVGASLIDEGLSTEEIVCSLQETALANAVAASAAYPLLLAPVRMRLSFDEYCRYRKLRVDSDTKRPSCVNVSFTDGGLSDNLAVNTLLAGYAGWKDIPLVGNKMGEMRLILSCLNEIIVLNAGLPVGDPDALPASARWRSTAIRRAIGWGLDQRDDLRAFALQSLIERAGKRFEFVPAQPLAVKGIAFDLAYDAALIRTDLDPLSNIELVTLVLMGSSMMWSTLARLNMVSKEFPVDYEKFILSLLPKHVLQGLPHDTMTWLSHIRWSRFRVRPLREAMRLVNRFIDAKLRPADDDNRITGQERQAPQSQDDSVNEAMDSNQESR